MYDVETQLVTYTTAVFGFPISKKPARLCLGCEFAPENYADGLVGIGWIDPNKIYLVSKAEARRFGTHNPSSLPAIRGAFEHSLAVLRNFSPTILSSFGTELGPRL